LRTRKIAMDFFIRKRFIFSLGIIFLVILIVSFFAIDTLRLQKYDSVRINLSGRQRMLSQKMTKEILLYNFGGVSKDAVLSTVKVFDTTLIALKDGGDAPLDLSMTEFEAIPEMENKETKDQLEKVMSSWSTFKQKIESVLENNDSSSMNYIIDNNTKLLNEVDAAVAMMQHNAEEKITRLYWIVALGILVSVLILIVAITKETQRKYVEQIEQANIHLQEEAIQRKQAEEELKKHRDHLEELVGERTAELEKSNEQLRASETSLAHAQRIAHLGSWDWDIVNNTLHWSDEIYRIFGLEPQQFGATYEAFLNTVHPDDRAFVQKSVDEALYQNKPYSIEHRIVLPDGSVRVIQEQGDVTFDDSGEPIRMLGTVQDITERKKMEEQLIVTDRLASIGELSSGIAHELNNPLTGVIGFSELLLDRDLPDDIKEDLEVINREAKRTAGIVRNLLTFARKHDTEKRLVNINSIIEKVLELRAYEQKVSNIEVDTQFTSDLPEIMADGFQLQQVFINIIINAEHFMKEAHGRGTLTITTEQVGDIIRASFADDGPGIAEENLGHLFDPFFTTKEVGKGTGLGLSISYGIITDHGGRIRAESELGKGATFIIELPVSTTDNEGTTNENS